MRCHVFTQKRSSLFCAAIFFVAALGASAQSQISVPGMSKYTDSGFGFSFWYPTSWKLTQRPVTDPTGYGWFQGGTIVKEFDLANPETSDDDPAGVIIQEFSSPTNSITELGQTKSAKPVGADQSYFFDGRTHTWMYEYSRQRQTTILPELCQPIFQVTQWEGCTYSTGPNGMERTVLLS